ncbi:cathepsin G-like [Emys orbicularis]|uniref:cathepsin G-like n=1 Tax=Emys orbicularis TaxID=82168 RepID=UPI0031FCE638
MVQRMQLFILVLLPMAFLLPQGCQSGEIIGGQEAQPHSRPYMAYLDIQSGDKRFRYGGFLVSKNFVLTATHCNGDRITVYLGAHNIQQREQSQQIPVHCWIPHLQYNRETRNNDMMLLQLSHSAVLNNWVRLIPLPNANSRVRPGSMCSVAGWGRTGWNIRTDMLREVDLEVMRDNMCELYSGYNPSMMLCVGKPGMCTLPYRGDSGGPLACDRVAQGIASYVDGNFY